MLLLASLDGNARVKQSQVGSFTALGILNYICVLGHISSGPATLGAEEAKGRTACHSASAMLARQVSTKEVGTHKRGAQTSLADDVSGQFQLFCLGSSIGFESSRINVKQRGRLGLQVGN